MFVKTDNDHSNSPAVIHTIATSLRNVGEKDAAELVDLIQSDNGEFFCQVKTTTRDVTVPKQTTVAVYCRANTGPVGSKTPVLFEPDERSEWPTGLVVHETLTIVKEGKTTVLQIQVTNDTMHDVVLLGELY